MNTLHNYKLSENCMYHYIKTHSKNSKKPTCIPQKHPLNSVIASDAWRMHVLHKTLLHCSTFVNMLYRQATSAIAQALVRLLA